MVPPQIASGRSPYDQVKAELDAKMRAVSAKREAEEKLKGLQKKRVLLAAQRDAQAKQRNQLELRRIRASQAIGNHIKEMSLAMMELEAELEPLRARAAEEGPASRAAGEVAALSEQLRSATARRDALQARLQAQDFLPPEEEASMREMDDAIDALDAELECASLHQLATPPLPLPRQNVAYPFYVPLRLSIIRFVYPYPGGNRNVNPWGGSGKRV